MSETAQRRAVARYRSRLSERGIVRFEVQALETDRALIRDLARRLASEGADGGPLRQTLVQIVRSEPPRTGGVLAALRRSPLVGADLDLDRPREEGRPVDL